MFPDADPPADGSSDSTAAPDQATAAPKRVGGRPQVLASTPEVEARRAADRERKRLAKLKALEPKPEPVPVMVNTVNDAAAVIVESERKRRARRSTGGRGGGREPAAPAPIRAPGWLRRMLEAADDKTGRAVSQLRHLALSILERDGLAWAQECLADPNAKDSDRAKAFDLVAKLSAGYTTPDMAGSEDVPDLPAPIFELSEGDLPGEQVPGSLAEEDGSRDEEDTGGPQLTSSAAPDGSVAPVAAPSAPAGPIPHMGAA